MKSRQQDANIHFMGEFIMSIRRLLVTVLMGMFLVTVQTSIADEPPSESNAAPSYRVFVVSHTHSDLCWPNSIEACLDANVAAIAKSVEIAEREPSYRFTMEHALFLREYLRRYPDKQDVVKRLMQSGAIEIGAFYTGPWELTCGGEGLVRQLYLGKRWLKEHLGVDALYVWNVDVAGHTAQMPQILRKAGIEGLVISAGATDNTFEQPYVLHETRGPFLFRWQSPDGSIVPTWSTPWGYGAGEIMGLRKNDLKEFAQKLPTFLEDIRKNHSAHGLPKIAFLTDGTDIQSPSSQVDANIQKWNETKRLSPMTHASTAELFAAVAKESLPTYPGEMPSPWDSMQAQGNECFMLDRRLEGRLLAAEKAASLASLLTPAFAYPHNTFTKIWENRLFAVEHNWGGNKGEISDRQKTDKIEEACRWNDGNLQTALDAVAAAIRPARQDATPIIVFNPLSWDRRDIVVCDVPLPKEKAENLGIVDSANKPIPHQIVARGSGEQAGAVRVAFPADVPSLGYATYYVVEEQSTAPAALPFQVDEANTTFENRFYRIRFDPSTGAIQSILDKRTQNELVRQGGKYQCNELIAVEDNEVDIRMHLTGKEWRMREHPSKIRVAENGPVRLVIEVDGRLLEGSTCRQEIFLYQDLPRIDLATTVDWEGKRNVQLHQIFPLNVPNPTARYAVPYGWQEYGKELKYAAPWPFGPIAGYPSRGVRGWIELANESTRVSLASECNFAAFKDLSADAGVEFVIQPLLLRTVRSCGNEGLYYEQKGKHRFRFSLQSSADSARLGAEFDSPLLSQAVKPSPASGSLPDRLSLVRIKPENVQIAVVKKAEDDRGFILRLVEVKGSKEQHRAEVQFARPVKEAVKTNIIEEDEAALSTDGDSVSIPIAPFGIETVRVSF
jgi:alpha-mannosidase